MKDYEKAYVWYWGVSFTLTIVVLIVAYRCFFYQLTQ